jgi:hypothetical protein
MGVKKRGCSPLRPPAKEGTQHAPDDLPSDLAADGMGRAFGGGGKESASL